MASIASIKMVGDWTKQVSMPLHDYIGISMDVLGRNGEQACKHAIIKMAQSARAQTPQSPKNRKIERDGELRGAQFVTVFKSNGEESRIYKFQFDKRAQREGSALKGTWEQARNIAHRGLAKRSWMWGLKAFGKDDSGQKPLNGVTTLKTVLGEKSCGYVLTDKLTYLMKILASGWSAAVGQAYGNQVMHAAARKIERDVARELSQARRGGAATGAALGNFFLRGA
jgi:hypothetical protein